MSPQPWPSFDYDKLLAYYRSINAEAADKSIVAQLNAQNVIESGGTHTSDKISVPVRVDGALRSVDDLKQLPIAHSRHTLPARPRSHCTQTTPSPSRRRHQSRLMAERCGLCRSGRVIYQG